jgi:hypothetical protein
MRKVLLICLAVSSSLLVGCGYEDTKYKKYDVDVFDVNCSQRIFIDKETGVQYIIIGSGNDRCMSVRLDANGEPMVDRSVK